MQMPLVMLHGDMYGRSRGRIAGRARGRIAADIPLDYDVPTYPKTTSSSRASTVIDLAKGGIDIALQWLGLERDKATSATQRAQIDAEIAALQAGKTPQEVYGMQYIPWIIGGAAVLALMLFFSKSRGRR